MIKRIVPCVLGRLVREERPATPNLIFFPRHGLTTRSPVVCPGAQELISKPSQRPRCPVLRYAVGRYTLDNRSSLIICRVDTQKCSSRRRRRGGHSERIVAHGAASVIRHVAGVIVGEKVVVIRRTRNTIRYSGAEATTSCASAESCLLPDEVA